MFKFFRSQIFWALVVYVFMWSLVVYGLLHVDMQQNAPKEMKTEVEMPIIPEASQVIVMIEVFDLQGNRIKLVNNYNAVKELLSFPRENSHAFSDGVYLVASHRFGGVKPKLRKLLKLDGGFVYHPQERSYELEK